MDWNRNEGQFQKNGHNEIRELDEWDNRNVPVCPELSGRKKGRKCVEKYQTTKKISTKKCADLNIPFSRYKIEFDGCI